MKYKKFMPCIWLYQKRAVQSRDNLKELEFDPVALAENYNSMHCDSIFVYDLSYDDASHDEALDVIKEICLQVAVPVVGCGNIKRMEDVKKLLYAGCSQVAVEYAKDPELTLTKEVSLKFGQNKIILYIDSVSQIADFDPSVYEYVSEIYLKNGAGIREAALMSRLPVLAFLPEVGLDKIIEVLSFANVSGLSGSVINDNYRNLEALKKLCSDNQIPVRQMYAAYSWNEFKKGPDGLVPVIVQDAKTDAVLMMAYMNQEAYEKTVHSGRMTYFSRSRGKLWLKGETSGHFQYVHSLTADCDMDTILAKVSQVGPACHTGSYSCFFNEIINFSEKSENHNPMHVFDEVFAVIEDRKRNPKEGSYTNYLFDKGIDKILKKLGEEATEIVIAAKNPNPNEIKYEIADFLYHMMVLMAEKNVTWEEITTELANR